MLNWTQNPAVLGTMGVRPPPFGTTDSIGLTPASSPAVPMVVVTDLVTKSSSFQIASQRFFGREVGVVPLRNLNRGVIIRV
jgi:hypothetical protein